MFVSTEADAKEEATDDADDELGADVRDAPIDADVGFLRSCSVRWANSCVSEPTGGVATLPPPTLPTPVEDAAGFGTRSQNQNQPNLIRKLSHTRTSHIVERAFRREKHSIKKQNKWKMKKWFRVWKVKRMAKEKSEVFFYPFE